MRGAALRDDNVDTVVRIPFDFDPDRPAGTPSTDAEIGRAEYCREQIVAALLGAGWPMPALGMSGNGAHALWRCCIKASPTWKATAQGLYAGVARQFADVFAAAGVKFDTTVRNPARIWRLYGSVNRKGEPTPERPHREARIVLPAGPWQVVRPEQIERLVALWAPQAQRERKVVDLDQARQLRSGSGDYTTLDAIAWFAAHGAYLRPLDAGKHAVRCPWAHEHTTSSPATGSDTVVFDDPGRWPTFHCSHSHCAGRSILDVMQVWGDADRYCARAWEGRRHG
jgi:hypothetical protein